MYQKLVNKTFQFAFQPELTNAVANVICLIVLGKRFEYDDPEFQRVIEIFDERYNSSINAFYCLICNFSGSIC